MIHWKSRRSEGGPRRGVALLLALLTLGPMATAAAAQDPMTSGFSAVTLPPVLGDHVIVHTDDLTGDVYAVNGRFVSSAGLRSKPSMSAVEALEVVAKEAGIFG